MISQNACWVGKDPRITRIVSSVASVFWTPALHQMNGNLILFRGGFVSPDMLQLIHICLYKTCSKILLCCFSDLKSGEMNFILYRQCDQLRLAEWYCSFLAARDDFITRIHTAAYFMCSMVFSHGELSEGTNWQFNFKNVDFRSISPECNYGWELYYTLEES